MILSFRKLITLGVIIAVASGCASTQPKLLAELDKELNTPLICESEISCKEMWERATYFVTINAGFKIQTDNDTVIETYNPSDSSPRLAFKITKEPKGGGKYQI